jgi:epoxyqueuosine reductase
MTSARDKIQAEAIKLGFSSFGITKPGSIAQAGARLDHFLHEGRHGDMQWMVDKAPWRRDPQALWPEVRSIIMLGMNYGPDLDPLEILNHPTRAGISVYARGRDYHDVIKGRLKRLGGWMHHQYKADVKVFVDTAPVMEKPLGEAAGLGWQGKHTNLISREFGSWLFLGSIFTTLDLEPDAPESDHCGQCTRCLDACPTQAFTAPYQLDARRCISYLTIESKDQIPREFRRAMGNRIYGCDDCLSVCPWNKFAQTAAEQAFFAKSQLNAPPISDLLALDDAHFRLFFSGSPVKRIGRDRFIRNTLVAAGNSGEQALIPHIIPHLDDPSALVRGMAIWALGRLMAPADFTILKNARLPLEADAQVRDEWVQPEG